MKVEILRAHSKRKWIPFAWIIKKTQKTTWHHYAIDCSHFVMDAKRKGIRKINAEKWNKEYDVVSRDTIELPVEHEDVEDWLESKIGTKYAFWQLIGIGLISFGWIKNNPFGKDRKYLVCHEFVLVMLAHFLKIEIGDSDNYTFRAVEEIIKQASEL